MSDEDIELEYEENDSHEIERRIKRNQMERNVRRTKLLIQQIRAVFALFVAIGMCFCLFKFANCKYWYLPSHVFSQIENNKRVTLEGNVVTSSERIKAILSQIELPHLPI